MQKILMVALGGSIGAVARYLLSLWSAQRYGAAFPYGTLFANIIGCFIIGVFMTLATEKWIISPYWRLLVSVGFIGGLTTFSSFSYETFKLIEDGQLQYAVYNVGLNFFLGFIATWLGINIARVAG